MVPHASVKEFFLNKDINEKRFGWITKVMGYDINIKITNLVRSKGFCEKMTSSFETHEKAALLIQGEKPMENEDQTDWLHDMTTFLIEWRYPQGRDRAKRRQFILQAIPYVLVDGILFKKDYDSLIKMHIDISNK